MENLWASAAMSCLVMLDGKRVNFNMVVIPMNCYFFQQLNDFYGCGWCALVEVDSLE